MAQCFQRHTVGSHFQLVGHDFKRAGLTTQGVDISHTRHRAEGGTDHPIEQVTLLHQRQRVTFNGEHEDFAERRRDGRDTAGNTRWQIILNIVQTFGHLLPRPINVRTIGKLEGDVGDSILVGGAQHLLMRDAEHFHFDGYGDTGFNFFRRHARSLEHNFDLYRRHLREGVNRQFSESQPTASGDDNDHQQHKKPL